MASYLSMFSIGVLTGYLWGYIDAIAVVVGF